MSTRTVSVSGDDIAVAEGGAGAPVLVLGDIIGPAAAMFLSSLARAGAVQAPTHPGYNGAPHPDWLETVSDLANFYLDYLKARDLRGVHLVGLGIGGWIAADLAVRNSDRLKSLTLVNAAGVRVAGVNQCDIFLGTEDEALRKLIHDPAIATRAIAETLTPESEDTRLLNNQYLARLTWQPRLHDPHLQKWLRRIDKPTLVVWSENNLLFPRAYGVAWRDAIPGATLAALPDCGHAAAYEQPEGLAARIAQFIAAQGGAT